MSKIVGYRADALGLLSLREDVTDVVVFPLQCTKACKISDLKYVASDIIGVIRADYCQSNHTLR